MNVKPITAWASVDPEGKIYIPLIDTDQAYLKQRRANLWGDRDYEVLGWKVIEVSITPKVKVEPVT